MTADVAAIMPDDGGRISGREPLFESLSTSTRTSPASGTIEAEEPGRSTPDEPGRNTFDEPEPIFEAPPTELPMPLRNEAKPASGSTDEPIPDALPPPSRKASSAATTSSIV